MVKPVEVERPLCPECGKVLTQAGTYGQEGIVQSYYQCMNFGDCSNRRVFTEKGSLAFPKPHEIASTDKTVR